MNEHYKNDPLVQSMVVAMPYVHELMIPIKPISADTKVLDVLKLFDIYTELLALSVLDNNNFIGLMTRYHYLNLMPRVFANQLFTDSRLKDLLETDANIFAAPLIADVDDRIDQIVLELLTFGVKIDILPVANKTGVLGIVKMTDMTLKLFDMQKKLIDAEVQMNERLKNEVENAAIMQHNLLRPSKIDLLGVRGLATLITCSEIGGDFYDYYAVDNRWVVLIVGDVSGHGVASGTVVSIAKATVNLLETDHEKEPYKILERLSSTILKTARQSLLMTMFVACLDTRTGELRYANAGHQFPYLYRLANCRLDMLDEAGGLPLGKLENVTYEQYITQMDVGDRLFIYTDAIVEEENPEGECFGYDHLEALLNDNITSDSEHLRDVLLERFTSHVECYEFGDDVTIFHVEFYQHSNDSAC